MRVISFTFFLFAFNYTQAQNRDSLLAVWNNQGVHDSVRVNAMYDLAWEYIYLQTDSALTYAKLGYDLALKNGNENKQADLLNTHGVIFLVKSNVAIARTYFETALALAQKNNYESAISSSQSNLGSVAMGEGNLPEALLHYTEAYRLFQKNGNKTGESKVLNNLGLILEEQGELDKALLQFQSALKLKQEIGSSTGSCLINLGNIYQLKGDLPAALKNYEEAKEIFLLDNDLWNAADALSEIASIMFATGNTAGALTNLFESISMAKAVGNKDGESFATLEIGKIYLQNNEYQSAKTYCEQALAMSEKTGGLNLQSESCLCLSQALKKTGHYNEALDFHVKHIQLRDSLHTLQALDEVAKLTLTHEFELKQISDSLKREEDQLKIDYDHKTDLAAKKNERNITIVLALAILSLALLLASRLRFVSRTKKIIQQERERSDNLLLNILPDSVARELKDHGKSVAKHYDNVTVLFTDFHGFTSLAEAMTPTELINEIDWCFQSFDVVAYRFGLEKIKTIGDSYMAVAGMPETNTADAKNAVLAALEMARIIDERYAERTAENLPAFQMRTGLHNGSVVAGVVGLKKFQYDVWGDTVNTASRMESAGEVNEVNISQATYDLIKGESRFSFVSRGKIKVKNKGDMEMYFVRLNGDHASV